ncbi:hypothetical protein EON66_02855 [archaeon]|nr:MAG: hypothetical protein EON66_02855 [archaeon]
MCCSAKNIKNDAKRNEDVNEMLIRQLREEIESLRKALASAQGGTSETSISDAQRAHMEEMIANLERAKQQSWYVPRVRVRVQQVRTNACSVMAG